MLDIDKVFCYTGFSGCGSDAPREKAQASAQESRFSKAAQPGGQLGSK